MASKAPSVESQGALNVKNLSSELKLVADWHQLGIRLDLLPAQLRQIEKEHPGDIERRKVEVVDIWLQHTLGASWRHIVTALIEMGHLTTAERIELNYVKGARVGSHQAELSKVDVFASENRHTINGKFADLLTNVCNKMSKNKVDIENFLLFVAALFSPGDCIPALPTNLTKVFDAITHHGLWDSLHYSPLVRIVRKFGAGDSEMKAWIRDYKKDVKAYTIVASIEDCIDSDLDTCTDQSRADSAKYDPRYNCPVEWKTDFVDHSLQYLTDVWEMFSDKFLVPDSPPTALLDRVRRGCVSVTWLVPAYLIPQLIKRVKINIRFFRKHHILKVTVAGEVVYEEGAKKATEVEEEAAKKATEGEENESDVEETEEARLSEAKTGSIRQPIPIKEETQGTLTMDHQPSQSTIPIKEETQGTLTMDHQPSPSAIPIREGAEVTITMDRQPIPIEGAEPSLKILQNELQGVCANWFMFGVQLEIDTGTLKRIQRDCKEDVAQCMVELLIEWRKNKPASWKRIVEALKSRAVSEISLADYIESKYCRHHNLSGLPEEFGDDHSSQKGDFSTQPCYSSSVPANLMHYAPKRECRRLSEPNRLPESETEIEAKKLIQEQKRQIQERDRRIQELEKQLDHQIQELEQQMDHQIQELERQIQEKNSIIKSQKRSLPKGIRGSAAIERNMAYFRIGEDPYVHEYNSSNNEWRCIYPECPFLRFGIAVINGLVTAVGGLEKFEVVGTLLSLTGEGKYTEWSKEFDPMPTKRLYPGIVRCGTSLIVAGGTSSGLDGGSLVTVEVMNTETSKWTTARSLPHPFLDAWLTVCGTRVYMLGGNVLKTPRKAALSCSLDDLLVNVKSRVWDKICDVPVYSATCATVNGQLLAVGGKPQDEENCTSIYAFDPAKESWRLISNMKTARSFCLAAGLPNNKLMIVGGFVQGQHLYDVPTNNVETIDIPGQN